MPTKIEGTFQDAWEVLRHSGVTYVPKIPLTHVHWICRALLIPPPPPPPPPRPLLLLTRHADLSSHLQGSVSRTKTSSSQMGNSPASISNVGALFPHIPCQVTLCFMLGVIV